MISKDKKRIQVSLSKEVIESANNYLKKLNTHNEIDTYITFSMYVEDLIKDDLNHLGFINLYKDFINK